MATDRQLAQQFRRDRERSLPHQFRSRQLGQQARQNQEHELIARQPLDSQLASTISLHHQLDRCDVLCRFCNAEHWIEERVQGSMKSSPKFSTCCESGAVKIDKFDNPPQPLYSLLMDSTPCIFPCHIFVDDEWQYNSARTFEIITMTSCSVPLVLKETCLFMVLKVYILFISKDNCVISSDLYFHYQGNNLHFRRSISTIQILWNKHDIAYLTIMIYLM